MAFSYDVKKIEGINGQYIVTVWVQWRNFKETFSLAGMPLDTRKSFESALREYMRAYKAGKDLEKSVPSISPIFRDKTTLQKES